MYNCIIYSLVFFLRIFNSNNILRITDLQEFDIGYMLITL